MAARKGAVEPDFPMAALRGETVASALLWAALFKAVALVLQTVLYCFVLSFFVYIFLNYYSLLVLKI